MTRVRTLILCLFALAAVCAATAGGASAAGFHPEWGKCEPTAESTGGKYGNAGCTAQVKATHHEYLGGYEWYPLKHEPEEIEEEESTNIKYLSVNLEGGITQPTSETAITFADGHSITCGPLIPETEIRLGSAQMTTEAPLFAFNRCVDEQGEECTTVFAPRQINTEAAWRHGLKHQEGSWTGTTEFIEGKNTPHPKVGIVFEAEHPTEPMFQQIVCQAEQPGSTPLSISIGGHKEGEALTTAIEPVNKMTTAFTAELGPLAHKIAHTKPLLAQVNVGEWEPVTINTTMLFPEVYAGYDQHNHSNLELELKATK